MTGCRLRAFCLVATAVLVVGRPDLYAGQVTISLVTAKDGKREPLEQFCGLRRSPYGGWVVALWPFGMTVGEAAVFEYRSELLQQAWEMIDKEEKPSKDLDADDTFLKELGIDGPAVVPGISRPSTAKVKLGEGDHVLMPAAIRATVKQGELRSDDPRVRIDRDADVIEIACHPVTIRAFNEVRSVAAPMVVSYDGVDLVQGVLKPLEDPEKRKRPQSDERQDGRSRFRRITIYLPPTSGSGRYRLNGVPFAVGSDGEVKVGRSERVELVGDSELRLRLPPAAPQYLVGKRWLRGSTPATVEGFPGIPLCPEGAETASTAIPSAQKECAIAFSLEDRRARAYTVTVPSTFGDYPYKTAMFHPSSRSSYVFETGQLLVPPGGHYVCRFMPHGQGRTPGTELPCRLEPLYREGGSVALALTGPGTGTFSAQLPGSVGEGLWQLVCAEAGPLQDHPLALIVVTRQKAPATISLYTYRNRTVFLREDSVDVYWTVRTPADSPALGEFEVVLVGAAFERVVARDAGRQSPVTTGHVRIATDALAPGLYQVQVRPPAIVSYSTHFFVCQRETLSDFGINSYAPFGESGMDAGTPVIAFYGRGPASDEPGLAPIADWARSGLDIAYAIYASSPFGPAAEKFVRPSEDEIGLMTLARAGKRAKVQMPVMLHHEEWNPKHTLPEELRRLRRRNALFTQKYADVAGFTGLNLNWYATTHGYWEEVQCLDGHQARRNAEAGKWVSRQVVERVEAEKQRNPDPKHLEIIRKQAGYESWGLVLATAYGHYLKDANVIEPGLTAHTGIPSFWLGGGRSYPPSAYSTLTHRDCVDYTDYCRPPWSSFRAPAFLDLNNPDRQPTQMATAAAGRHARFIVAFGGAGRGLDGFAFPSGEEPPMGDHEQLLRIFERFGSYFRALDPLPDVAVYFSKSTAWAHQISVILHDLARLRRPGVLLTAEQIARGELSEYKVLFLPAIGERETAAVRQAFTEFEKNGGYIIKEGHTAKSYPGVELGLRYDGKHVPGRAWGLGGPNGEWEFAHLWTNFLEHREQPLLEAFAEAPPSSVSTSDKEIVISPLAGRESICCFVINMTYVPMSVQGKWRQHAALPRKGDLLVEKGWHVRDLLTGKPCKVVENDGRNTVEMDFSRAEGRIVLLTRREPKSMVMELGREPTELSVRAWLTDAAGTALPDPMPFEVTLTGPGGATLFHKYSVLGPNCPLPIALPAMKDGATLEVTVRDLVLGCSATQTVTPLPLDWFGSSDLDGGSVDCIGADQIWPFLHARKNRVIVLLDEGQGRYRPAAEAMVSLLKKNGRDAKIMFLDAAEVQEQPLRWHWTDEDQERLARVSAGELIAWRVTLAPYDKEFTDPLCGYGEYGPQTWIDGDLVLFGGPKDNRALDDLGEFLRRRPSESFPSPGRFFLHYVWDPFLGECDALYIGCNDPAGALAAVDYLPKLPKPTEGETPHAVSRLAQVKPGPATPLEDMYTERFGPKIVDVAYSPSGRRIFLSVDSYGDCFFVLDPEGKILSSRPIGNRFWNNIWYSGSGGLRPFSDEELYVRMGSNNFLFNLQKGFLHKTASPPHGLPGRVRVTPGGPVLHQDFERKRTYLGGKCQLVALDDAGNLLWRYNDADHRTSTGDMLHRRSIFIRGVSPNGKRLLCTAFGVAQDVYGIGSPQNWSVFCVDTDSGKVRWAKNGLYLNQGKAILTNDRFVIVDDDGQFHLLNADTGERAGQFRAVGGTDVIRPVPNSDLLLIVENNRFDRNGASSRVYLRAPGDKPDIILDLPGRIRHAVLTPDGTRVVLSSQRGQTACFGLDGKRQWQIDAPAGGVVRFSPDGQTTLVGSEIGKLFFLETGSGQIIRTMDFCPYNLTSPEQYVKQLSNVGAVPVAKAARVPPAAPEPSYLDSLDQKAVSFGPNLLPQKTLLAKLKTAQLPEDDPAEPRYVGLLEGPAEFQLEVEPKTTYLIEFLNAAGDASPLTPQMRAEVSVRGFKASKHLPCTGRLPIGKLCARRRMAFRTADEKLVTLSIRVVAPTKTGEGRRARLSYEPGETSKLPMPIGDMVVAAIKFRSRNFLKTHEHRVEALGGGGAPAPRGWVECQFHRWSGGDSRFKKWSWKAPQRALGLCDGIISSQETKWQEARDAVTGTRISYATAKVTFKKPETITAIAIYEDNRGPALSRNVVREMTTAHYGLYRDRRRRRMGYVVDNTNLVNIFTFPPVKAKTFEYYWAGREFTHRTDGMIRMAEFEVYSTEESDFGFDEAGDGTEEEGVEEGLGLDVLE